MRLKQLLGLPVVDPSTARKIGSVLDYELDPASGRVAGLDVGRAESADAGADELRQRIVAQRIRRVGRHAVILNAGSDAMVEVTPIDDERVLGCANLVGLEVMGDDGNRIGQLLDATFDQDSLRIEHYLLRVSTLERLIPGRGRILPTRIVSSSRELMLVSASEVQPKRDLPTASPAESAPGLPVALKVDPRLPAPSFEPVPESQTAVVQTS